MEVSSISRLHGSPDLEGKILQIEYPLSVNSAGSPSYVWTSISATRKFLLLGIRQKIHSGYEVNVW